jgi:hypothetical protein
VSRSWGQKSDAPDAQWWWPLTDHPVERSVAPMRLTRRGRQAALLLVCTVLVFVVGLAVLLAALALAVPRY